MSETADNGVELTRRQMIVTSAGALAATSVLANSSVAAIAQAVGPKFLTKEELTLLDELTEMIIPTDEHSPGARAAKVAAYIDSRLAEAWEEQERTDWREGLKRIDQLSRESSGMSFMQSSADERLRVLTRIAQQEKEPRQPEELFFAKLKSRVVDAYYTSDVGIKQDMEYKGNSYLTEFVGVDVS